MKKILIPIGNQHNVDRPLEIAVKLGKEFDSTITLFHVVDFHRFDRIPHNIKGRYIEVIHDTTNDNNILKKVSELYEKEGIKTDIQVVEGDTASKILDKAENENYDLIIMETYNMKENKRFMLGSVTNKVVHHINVPIIILR